MDQLCPLCDEPINNHNTVFIDGDEAYACYRGDEINDKNKEKLTRWLESYERKDKDNHE